MRHACGRRAGRPLRGPDFKGARSDIRPVGEETEDRLDLTSPYVMIILLFAVALLVLRDRRHTRVGKGPAHPASGTKLLDEGTEPGYRFSPERLP